MSYSEPQRRRKLLVIDFWGLGDLTFATALLREAVKSWDVTLVGKKHARPLLEPTYPDLCFEVYDAPWSAFYGKYRLLNWDWSELTGLIGRLRREQFDAAVSVRNDSRDHLFMWLIGAKRRYGFPVRASRLFLTDCLIHSKPRQHKVEDWRVIGRALGLSTMEQADPYLDHTRYRTAHIDALVGHIDKPIICLHPGARIHVRRWPEEYFARIIGKLRKHFDFHLLLIPDPDGYGKALADLCDSELPPLALHELVDVLGRVDLLLCNDSGPGHIAASCGRPALPIFGPTDPEWFRPWGDIQKILIRDICPWRPCFDYCKFSEPHCMTKLFPETVWPEIHEHLLWLLKEGVLPARMLKAPTESAGQPSVAS